MRLFNILLEIVNYISSRGKTLWTGEWSSGTITVPGSSNYGTFMVNVGGQWMFANRTDPAGSPTVGGDIAFLSMDPLYIGGGVSPSFVRMGVAA